MKLKCSRGPCGGPGGRRTAITDFLITSQPRRKAYPETLSFPYSTTRVSELSDDGPVGVSNRSNFRVRLQHYPQRI